MYVNNFRRFFCLIALTLTLLVGTFTAPVFDQPALAQRNASAPRRPILCGEINSGLGATPSDAVSKAANCFFEAYTHCQEAILTADFSGIDAGVRRILFVLKEPSKCLVVNVAENYVLPNFTNDRVELCSSVQRNGTGLLLTNCEQDGDIVLPEGNS